MTPESPSRPPREELGTPWYAWGSPVGLGLLVLSLALSIGVLLAAVSLLT